MKQMYKVFFNERLIGICQEEKLAKQYPFVRFDLSANDVDIKNWFNSFKDEDIEEIFLLHPYPELFFKIFRSAFTEMPAAGGVLFSRESILFIFRNGKWDLPKGKIDQNEKAEDAAIREVSEECGIKGHEIVKPLRSTYHIYELQENDFKSKWIFKETFWFEMSYNRQDKAVPQLDEGITDVRWISADELKMVLENSYKNIKLLIAASYDHMGLI